MDRIQKIGSEIAGLNEAAGELFERTAAGIADAVDDDVLDRWAEITLSIASSGWHAWESSNVFMDITPDLLAARGQHELLRCGDYGVELCGFSFEPGASYFRGIETLMARSALDRALPIETAGRAIRSRYQHASSLIADYFRVAFEIAGGDAGWAIDDWTSIAESMSARQRADLSTFLTASGRAEAINWQFIHELQEVSERACLDYLSVWPQLLHWFELRDLNELEPVVMRYAAEAADDDGDFEAWLAAVLHVLPTLGPPERHLLVKLFEKLPEMVMARSLVKAVDRLPMTRAHVVESWMYGVHDYLPLNTDAACGFLSLESATSQIRLEGLLGQVNFADCKRLLQLYTEAIVGRRLAIEEQKEGGLDFRDMPSTDGLAVYLPAAISRYGTTEDNFALYRICLLHQLGYFEFGTFEFMRGQSWAAFKDHFNTFDNPALAATLFQILEDARVDWALARRYRGAAVDLDRFKADALVSLDEASAPGGLPPAVRYVTALQQFSLDGGPGEVPLEYREDIDALGREIERLKDASADVYLTMDVLARCYAIVAGVLASPVSIEIPSDETYEEESEEESEEDHDMAMPEPIEYRGKLEPDRARINLQMAELLEDEVDASDPDQESISLSMAIDPKNIKIEQLKKGEVQQTLGMMLTDLDRNGVEAEELEQTSQEKMEAFREFIKQQAREPDALAFYYDEWDCVIGDYRRQWCTLFEIRDVEEKPEFVEQTLADLRSVAGGVRRQLSHLRPELLRKVKGMEDGEELDLEKTVEAIVDKRAGFSPGERIYVQRQRKDRDVSALFLLDMSASTDDKIPDPTASAEKASHWDDDDFLHDYYGADVGVDTRKRIIDLEKESVVLMAEALERLGDNYSVCGFSGYGKDQIDYYLCKDFDEPYNIRVKGRIGGIKPCRSTRMGPAIRHATRRLVATESRIKALIIISDGYPQDFDYGEDRNDRDYGIKDTTMALTEARQKGVQPFCLTVDPSGHDYLREMCPDHQYMVIQDINQLPDELSKVYRSLTA